MEQIILNGITVEQLKEIITEAVKAGSEPKEKAKKEIPLQRKEEKFISRQETADLLHISLPTLNDLTKEGKLISYRIGSRVLYKPEEVFERVKRRNFTNLNKQIE